MNQASRELLKLLIEVRGHSKKDAMALMRGLAPEGQHSLLIELRRRALEGNGQRVLPIALGVAPRKAQEDPKSTKKVPYTVLLPPTMIEALKDLSEIDGEPVSHHIRAAIKAYLSRTRR